MKKKKKGLSPVVTTVILIALVVAIIGIIFFWFRGMVQEGVTKFGKNIQLVCEEIDFEVSYQSGDLNFVNNGNIPVYTFNIRLIETAGGYDTKDIKDYISNPGNDPTVDWPTAGLKQGMAKSVTMGEISGDKIEIIPVLIGTSSGGKKIFPCGEQYGKTIEIN
jgi:flagellin-like protein